MAGSHKVAIVTGSSRGIGKACALHLARAGFDIVVCARTLRGGQVFEHSSTVKQSNTTPLPGSLEETAAEIEALGKKALAVKLDLNERRDIENVVQRTKQEFGRVDVLVNNACYVGPGDMDAFVDVPDDIYAMQMQCNVLAPLYFCKLVVPIMVEQGGGRIIHIGSAAPWREPRQMPGEGGVNVVYAMTRAAMARFIPGLAKEVKRFNISIINVVPGLIASERVVQDHGALGFDPSRWMPVDVPAATCAFLATCRYPLFYSGKVVEAPAFVVDHDLVDGGKFPAPFGPDSWGLPRPVGRIDRHLTTLAE